MPSVNVFENVSINPASPLPHEAAAGKNIIDDEDIGRKITKWYMESQDASRDWRDEAMELYDLYSGHQFTEDEWAYMRDRPNPITPIQMNRVLPFIDMVIGHQIMNRQEVRYLPREMGDVHINEIITEAVKWADEECDAQEAITEAFQDMCICGMGWIEVYMDYSKETQGKIISAERISPLQMYWDSEASKRNILDAQYLMRAKWYSREEAEDMFPEIKDFVTMDGSFDSTIPSKSQTFATDYGEYGEGPRARMWYRRGRNEVLILQTQYYKTETVYLDDEGREIPRDQLRAIEEVARDFKNILPIERPHTTRKKVKRARQVFSYGPHILEHTRAPADSPTLLCMTAKRDLTRKYWFGLCRQMKDPQKWANKFFTDIQYIISTNRKGGAFVEQDAFVNVREAEENWANPDGIIYVRPGGLTKIQERQGIQYPTGLDRLFEFAINSLPHVTGINPEMMGMVNRQQAGVLEESRKQSGFTILAPLFDSLRLFNRERGRLLLQFIQQYLSDGRLVRVVGSSGDIRYLPLLRDQTLGEYDVIVDEAPTSPHFKERVLSVLVHLLPTLQQVGIPLTQDLLDFLPLPSTIIARWKETINEQTQAASQAAQSDPDRQKKQAETAKTMAEAEGKQMENQMQPILGMMKASIGPTISGKGESVRGQ